MTTHTISGTATLPDDLSPLARGTWAIGIYTDTGVAFDDDGSWRAGVVHYSLDATGSLSLTLPATDGSFLYSASFESKDKKIKLGPYLFDLTANKTWQDVIETPTLVPLTPSLVAQAQAAAAAAAASAAAAAADDGSLDIVDAGSTAGTARPAVSGPVLWLVNPGVTLTNAQAQDLIAERDDAGATAAAMHQSVDAGFFTWSYDPSVAASQTAPGSGSMMVARVRARKSGTVANLNAYVGTVATGLTYARMSLHALDGTQLGLSTDQTTAFTSLGHKVCPLAVGAPVAAGTEYLIALLQVGTTPAALLRGYSGSAGGGGNVGYTASPFRYNSQNSLSAIPSPLVLANLGASSVAWWMAMS